MSAAENDRAPIEGDLQGILESGQERELAAWMLGFPWIWPAPGRLRDLATATGAGTPDTEARGEVLLVSVAAAAHVPRTALWRLAPFRPDSHPTVGFRDAALRFLKDSAPVLLGRDLPWIAEFRAFRTEPEWTATQIVKTGPGGDVILDGKSLGLSMALALASLVLDLPVPCNTAASCALTHDGQAGPVGGLEAKIALLSRAARAVTRVLVPADQADEARAAARGLRPDLGIVPVRDLAEAIHETWPDLDSNFRTRLSDPPRLKSLAGEIFRILLHEREFHDSPWPAVKRTVDLLLELHGTVPLDDRDTLNRLRCSSSIVRRHLNEDCEFPWPDQDWLETLPDSDQSALLAHLVQHAADFGDESMRRNHAGHAERILCAKPRSKHDEPELMLLGAIGRTRAALFEYPAALDVLENATRYWIEMGGWPKCSRALCEALRLVGICGDAMRFDRIEREVVGPLMSRRCLEAMSLGFVRLALGRALVQIGRPFRSLEPLGDRDGLDWSLMPDHLQATRLRWLARARTSQGLETEAAAAAAALKDLARRAPIAFEWDLLHQLDLALESDSDPVPLLEALRSTPNGRDYQRLWEHDGPDVRRGARRVADECRY